MPFVTFVFKKEAQTQMENVVKWCAGPMVHVDVIPNDNKFMFTSYMFERFSVNRLQPYARETHECRRLELSETEHKTMQDVLVRFVDKQLPYNYTDVFSYMFRSLSSEQDVANEESVKSLFCSQAMLLALRYSLVENNALLEQINKTNSRMTTPNDLFTLLEPFTQSTDEHFSI